MSEISLEPRSRASPEQFAALLEFMESHGDITRPQQGAQGRIRADRLWQELRDILNAVGGGVAKTVEKWKKVWADWKAKTKKKALLRHKEMCGTGGGPSSRCTISNFEQRVLGVMGIRTVLGNEMVEEAGFDEPLSSVPVPPPTELPPSQSHLGDIVGHFPMYTEVTVNTAPAAARLLTPPPDWRILTPPPRRSPAASTSRPAPRRRRCPTSPSPEVSPTASMLTPRRTRLSQTRARRIQTPFERATKRFVAVENRRLQLEEEREKNLHQRETERLRIESKRLQIQQNQAQILNRLEKSLENMTQILLQRPP